MQGMFFYVWAWLLSLYFSRKKCSIISFSVVPPPPGPTPSDLSGSDSQSVFFYVVFSEAITLIYTLSIAQFVRDIYYSKLGPDKFGAILSLIST